MEKTDPVVKKTLGHSGQSSISSFKSVSATKQKEGAQVVKKITFHG